MPRVAGCPFESAEAGPGQPLLQRARGLGGKANTDDVTEACSTFCLLHRQSAAALIGAFRRWDAVAEGVLIFRQQTQSQPVPPITSWSEHQQVGQLARFTLSGCLSSGSLPSCRLEISQEPIDAQPLRTCPEMRTGAIIMIATYEGFLAACSSAEPLPPLDLMACHNCAPPANVLQALHGSEKRLFTLGCWRFLCLSPLCQIPFR